MASWTGDAFDQEMERIISHTATLNININTSQVIEAPLKWITIFKLALIATVNHQIAAGIGQEPCPTAQELIRQGLNEVSKAREFYLELKDPLDRKSLWEFDESVVKVSDETLKALRAEVISLLGESFWPDFRLVQATVCDALRLCGSMNVGLE